MARYFAELGLKDLVLRVIVCDDPEWPNKRLGGIWEETKLDDQVEAYAGIGMKCDKAKPEKFIPDPEKPPPKDDPIKDEEVVPPKSILSFLGIKKKG